MAGTCLRKSRRRIGLVPLLLVLLAFSLGTGSSSRATHHRSGSEARHIIWLFKPLMGMRIVSLAVYTHDERRLLYETIGRPWPCSPSRSRAPFIHPLMHRR
ncbi:hypothetical protein B0H13DRAFT_2036443, partial [Mycena leptocephala]